MNTSVDFGNPIYNKSVSGPSCKTKITTAEICSSSDSRQKVKVEFEYYSISKWFGESSTVFVNFCNVLNELILIPSDMIFDIEVAIAQAIGEGVENIRMECNVLHQYALIEENDSETEMLFI